MGENFWDRPDESVVPLKMSPEEVAERHKKEAMDKWEKIKKECFRKGDLKGVRRACNALNEISKFDNNP